MIDTDTAPTQLRVTKTPDQLANEVYDLEFYGTGETISNRLRQIRSFNQPDERIGGLLELRDLAQTAAAQGWAYRALDRMQLGIREYIPSAKTPLEKLLAEDVADYIDGETRESTLGLPIVVENDGRFVKSGRVSSDPSLLKDIPLDHDLLVADTARIRRLSTDIIALTDTAGMPVKVAEYHGELQGSGLGVLHRALDNYESPYSLIVDSLDVFDGARDAKPTDENIMKMAEILGVDPENLCDYIKVLYEIQAFQEKVYDTFTQIERTAENRNRELSRQFIEQALKDFDDYKGNDEYIRTNIEEATKSYRGGYIERAFTSVENALTRAGALNIEYLAESNVAPNDLIDLHAQSFQDARAERVKAEKDFEEEESSLIAKLTASRDRLREKLLGNEDKIIESFRSYVESIEQDMPMITWREYDGGVAGCMYEDGVVQRIEDVLSLKLEDLSFSAQQCLLRYMLTEDSTIFNRLESVLGNLREEIRTDVAEAFLATEFGDDYGDSILAIAEHATPEQSKEIFETIGSYRGSSKKIAGWFESYDAELTKDVELAMNERLSDALAAMEVLTRDGKLEVDVNPGRNSDGYVSDGRFEMQLHSIEEGIQIINALEKSLHLTHDVVTAPDVYTHPATKENGNFMMYRFSSEIEGDVVLYVRPDGAKGYDSQLEYGNREGVEASISFISNPTDPHNLDLYKDSQGVSIRFDREGRRTDESPFSEDRDPTRSDGSISLDISSIMGDGRHMPVKIGRFIAAGNILRAAKTGGEASLHHNTNHFEQSRYGSREGFAKLAVYIAHMAEAMIAIQREGSHASPYQSIPGKPRVA